MEGCGLHQPEDLQPSVLGGLIMSSNSELFVVTGGVHAKVALALQALARIEQEQKRKIAQVFSVGDFGLFLSESAWDFLTGLRDTSIRIGRLRSEKPGPGGSGRWQ
jgi:hypothetical protein